MAARYPHIDSDDDGVGDDYQSDSGHESDTVDLSDDSELQGDESVGELATEIESLAIKGNTSSNPEENTVATTWAVHRNSHPELDKYKILWAKEQLELKEKLSTDDSPEVLSWKEGTNKFKRLKFVGGVDISFIKGDEVNACAMLVILEYPSLNLLHKESAMVKLTLPYIPGFLAFREVPFLRERLDVVRKTKPDIIPQIILVDGNGILHPRGFGLASHLGVISDIPTIGVAKKLFSVDGLYKDDKHSANIRSLKLAGDSFPLVGSSGKTWGVALKGQTKVINPIYLSVGHKISLSTAEDLVFRCSRSRIPEPVRQADLRSREFIRKLVKNQSIAKPKEKDKDLFKDYTCKPGTMAKKENLKV